MDQLLNVNDFVHSSASEMVQQADASNEMEPTIMCRGLKFRLPENTAEELATIRTYQGESIMVIIIINLK